jgi:hypothetical protein
MCNIICVLLLEILKYDSGCNENSNNNENNNNNNESN